jgi:heme A synthase
MFAEALVGAGLVLFELVAHDASMKRGLSMILHLGNTFFLLGALTLTAWTLTFENARTVPNASEAAPTARRSAARSGGGGAAYRGRQLGATNRQALRSLRLWWLRGFALFPLLAVLFLGGTGAIAALGDTLFPAVSLSEGLRQDLSPLAHVFLRLRLLHPFIALATGAIVFASATMVRALSTSQLTRRLARVVTVVFATQFSIGLLNVTLLAPIPMQLLHLLMADATWIVLVLMGWEALYGQPFRDAARVHANDDVNDGDEAPAVATTRADAVM